MDEDDDNQLILSEEMLGPAYEADTFPLKPRHTDRNMYASGDVIFGEEFGHQRSC